MEFFDVVLSLIALIVLEVVLGIDNLVILSILTEKLPQEKRKKARRWGLTFAWMTRLMLLASAVFMVKLVKPLFSIGDMTFSARDIFLCLGGAFLIWKSTDEIHQDVTNESRTNSLPHGTSASATFRGVIIQVALLDIIFSLDSVLTAVGLTSHFWVMALAITCAIIIMIYASEPVSEFITKHPTIKMLALSYLILIGTVLVADGFSFHIPRGYLYFAMGFSLGVEALNLLRRTRRKRKKNKGK
ncbi:TerC family protein [Legionella worsleiensis]|uniref:Transport protein n=1 Tax=Legionella worsleiensis TaxID=45076 RepID=A0A0W1AJC6_9GAMM|nr:TerC family protein [Legionella worsleiensis]KTD81385.1 transport protein [Legionella worsleiensis]STY30019.1 transporter [Legionella worsleiensis]